MQSISYFSRIFFYQPNQNIWHRRINEFGSKKGVKGLKSCFFRRLLNGLSNFYDLLCRMCIPINILTKLYREQKMKIP